MDTEARPQSDGAKTQGLSQDQGAMRYSGRAMLLDRARRLHRQAAALERLAGALPGELPAEADEALWELASRM